MLDRVLKCCILALACCSWGSPTRAEDLYALEARVTRNPNDIQALMVLGKRYTTQFSDSHRLEDGNKAKDYIKKALVLRPSSAELKARLALVQCMVARETRSKDLAQTGFRELDAAVAASPNDLAVRAMRGFVGVEAPASFGRLDNGIRDLQMIADRVNSTPAVVRQYDLNMARVYLKLGIGYRDKGQKDRARAYWKMAERSAPDSTIGKNASRLLRKFM